MADNVRVTNLPDGKAATAYKMAVDIWGAPPSRNPKEFVKLVAACSRALSGEYTESRLPGTKADGSEF